jgi:predicted sulfurtransferase
MKIPRRCTNDEEAREALETSVHLRRPLHLALYPDYYSDNSSENLERDTNNQTILKPTNSAFLQTHAHLKGMPDPDRTPSFTLVSFYRFCNIADPDQVIADMRSLWQPFKVYGRVYVAEEGVNAQMAVPTNVLTYFEAASSMIDALRDQDERKGDVHNSSREVISDSTAVFRVNCDSRVMSVDEFHMHAPFRALHIRRRKQILVDGLPEPLDWRGVHDELSPREWHELVPSSSSSSHSASSTKANYAKPPVILDCRNKYESDVGRFDGAIPLDTNTFQESWAALETILKDTDPNTPIMTYCTGGIRCVKINAYLTQKMGFNNTSRLKGIIRTFNIHHLCVLTFLFVTGGIVAYARQRKEWELSNDSQDEKVSEGTLATSNSGTELGTLASKFKGVNYVFDERMGERITDDVLSKCSSCGTPHDMFSNCKHCSVRFLQCKSCAFDFASCCSETCKEGYLASLVEKPAQLAEKHRRAKQIQQGRQLQKVNGKKSFGKSENDQKVSKMGTGGHRSSLASPLNQQRSHFSTLTGKENATAVLDYCEMFSSSEPTILNDLRQETLQHCSSASHRMLCDPLQGRLLSLLSHIHKPFAVLELGTFTVLLLFIRYVLYFSEVSYIFSVILILYTIHVCRVTAHCALLRDCNRETDKHHTSLL